MFTYHWSKAHSCFEFKWFESSAGLCWGGLKQHQMSIRITAYWEKYSIWSMNSWMYTCFAKHFKNCSAKKLKKTELSGLIHSLVVLNSKIPHNYIVSMSTPLPWLVILLQARTTAPSTWWVIFCQQELLQDSVSYRVYSNVPGNGVWLQGWQQMVCL